MPIERKVYRVYVLKIKLFSNSSTNRALLTASSHLPKKSGSTDPAHHKRAGQWIPLIRKERVSGPRSSEKSVSVSGPSSSEKSGSADPAHQKRAGQRTQLIRKERVSGPSSSEKSGSADPAHQKRAGQRTQLIRKERVVGKMSPLIGQKERRAVIGLDRTLF